MFCGFMATVLHLPKRTSDWISHTADKHRGRWHIVLVCRHVQLIIVPRALYCLDIVRMGLKSPSRVHVLLRSVHSFRVLINLNA